MASTAKSTEVATTKRAPRPKYNILVNSKPNAKDVFPSIASVKAYVEETTPIRDSQFAAWRKGKTPDVLIYVVFNKDGEDVRVKRVMLFPISSR